MSVKYRLVTIEITISGTVLGVRVRLIRVSFKANKGNKFGDFGYCPLNRGCPLNTGFTVFTFFREVRAALEIAYVQKSPISFVARGKGSLRNAVANRVPAARWQGILFRINCEIISS